MLGLICSGESKIHDAFSEKLLSEILASWLIQCQLWHISLHAANVKLASQRNKEEYLIGTGGKGI